MYLSPQLLTLSNLEGLRECYSISRFTISNFKPRMFQLEGGIANGILWQNINKPSGKISASTYLLFSDSDGDFFDTIEKMFHVKFSSIHPFDDALTFLYL